MPTYHPAARFLRKLLGPLAGGAASVGALYGGLPPDLAPILAASVGQLVEGVMPEERSTAVVAADQANHSARARAYETFGASVIVCWQAAGLLCTFRPKVVGYLHGMAVLVRAQRRFEDQSASLAAALSGVLLYASTDTSHAAIGVVRELSARLRELHHAGRQGSPQIEDAYGKASLELGDKVVAWRATAQADLGLSGTQ